MAPEVKNPADASQKYVPIIEEMFAGCVKNAPNLGVREDCFRSSLLNTLNRFVAASGEPPTDAEIREFLASIHTDDLFLAIACSKGSERAWWEFDQQHRTYMERVARHLAKTDADSVDVVDTVYEQLYGTRIVDGERVSKFATYSGRGSLRGWLRTVIWHSLVDLHRAGREEVSLDEMTENVGEGAAHASFAVSPPGGEDSMLEKITRSRYRKATLAAIETAFDSLEDHERLLILYYHVENLKLREIARMVERENSPLRGWFQRRSQTRDKDPAARIHESTIMRWLEKSYGRVLHRFREELSSTHKLSPAETSVCMELAAEDLSGGGLFRNLST